MLIIHLQIEVNRMQLTLLSTIYKKKNQIRVLLNFKLNEFLINFN